VIFDSNNKERYGKPKLIMIIHKAMRLLRNTRTAEAIILDLFVDEFRTKKLAKDSGPVNYLA
jgi:hypothetical protein